MKSSPEDNLDSLISKAETPAVTGEDSYADGDLNGLLEIADRLSMIQFSIPTPKQRKLYLINEAHKPIAVWDNYTKIFKFFAWPAALIMLISISLPIYQASKTSLPGTALFPLKKIAEKTQIYTVQKNPDQLAQAQIDLTLKRLQELKVVMNTNPANPEMEKNAITELETQTKTALPIIKEAISQRPDPTLVRNLENLNRKLTELPDKTTSPDTAKTATELAKNSAEATQEILAIFAANSEQPEISLKNENYFEVKGRIKKIQDKSLVVENTVFTYQPQEIIIKSEANRIKISDLVQDTQVLVKGTRLPKGELEATEIVVLNELNTDIDTPSNSRPLNNTEPTEIPAPDPNKVNAGFIVEDPAPSQITNP